MRWLLLLLVWLGNTAVALAQMPGAKTYGERLDAVHSAAALYAFMSSLPPEAGNIDLSQDSLMQFAGESCFIYQIHTDSVEAEELDSCARYAILKQQLWARVDFDEDGRPDLFFNNGYGHAYAVLNRGAAIPLVVPLILRGSWRDCHSFTLVQQHGKWLIEHLQISRRRTTHAGRVKEPQVWQDTLVFNQGAFVEFNAHPNLTLPRTIGFGYRSGGPSSSSGFNILINTKTGRVKRQSVRYAEPHSIARFRYRLSPGALDTLRQQLTYLNSAGLHKVYSMDAYHASTVQLAFHYRNQPVKLVEDYGWQGTYGLRRLYDLIFDSYKQAEKRQETR